MDTNRSFCSAKYIRLKKILHVFWQMLDIHYICVKRQERGGGKSGKEKRPKRERIYHI